MSEVLQNRLESQEMTRQELLLFFVKQAAASVPGGQDAVNAIEGLVKHENDGVNDVDEIADLLAKAVIGAARAAESVSGKDVVNDAAFAQLVESVKGIIKLVPHVRAKAA
jgi:hypothetical protein